MADRFFPVRFQYAIFWSNAWLQSYERTETFVVTNIRQVLLYVNSNEKWTGMKNTGLKMPEKDQFYVRVGSESGFHTIREPKL